MNCNIYFFIGTQKGYSQYPENYSKEIISNILAKTDRKKNISQFAISKKGKLAYVTYQYRYTDSKYFGICCEYNNIVPTNFEYLFEFFDKIVQDILNKGEIIHYDSTGIIFPSIDYISDKIELVNYYSNYIGNHLNEQLAKYINLPSQNYTSEKKKVVVLAYDDNHTQLIDLLNTYDNIVIARDNPYVLGYANLLKKSNERISQLETELAKINRQKKQYRMVFFLILVVVGCLVGLYFLNDNLSGVISDQGDTINRMRNTINVRDAHIALLQDTLTEERNTIESQKTEIRMLNSNILSYQDSLKVSKMHNEELQASLSSCQSELTSSRRELSSCQTSLRKAENNLSTFKKKFPIDITDIEIANIYKGGDSETDYGYTIYSRNTMFLKPRIKYTGINSGRTITLKVKWYTPDGRLSTGASSPSGFSQSESLYVYSGSNTTTLNGWGDKTKGYWKKGTYRIEIWYEDVCLRAENFTIY